MKGEFALRYSLLSTIFAGVALMIAAQLVRIQVSPQASFFIDRGASYSREWHTVYPARGQIYDRWGRLLAGNRTVYEVGVELNQVRNPETIALTLMGVVQADYNDVFAAASQTYSSDPEKPAVYNVLADYVTEEQKEQIENMAEGFESEASSGRNKKEDKLPSLRGLVFKPHPQRSYPEKGVASNVLGFVSREGRGYFGVEENFNDLLAGQPVSVWKPVDPNKVEEAPDTPPGASLILTIDREIQSMVEQVLDSAILETGSEAGSILVMHPRTGEIMAMAVTPRMDLNEYWNYGNVFEGSTPFNRAVSQAYEPGSVYKVLTMAAALDSGTVEVDTPFLDTGIFEIGGIYIRNWNSGAWGPQTMLGCMQHSLNVCLAWVSSQVGPSQFYEYMKAFGIGRLTGIELGGEVPGRLKMPGDSDWYDADLGTNSFGQGVSATPLQMITAISAVANDGKMVAPRILRALVDRGHQFNTSPQVVGMPINGQTARDLTDMLAISLETEGSDSLVQGYRIAGKTGTAEIPTPYGYSSSATNASFVGWGPADDPRFIVYVWLNKPTTSPWGSVVAAPVFKQVVERLVVLIDLPPDDVRFNLMSSQ